MFVHPRVKTVAAFAPRHYPASSLFRPPIPSQTLFCRPPSYSCATYSALSQLDAKNRMAAWLVPVHNVLLDAVCDPGTVGKYSSFAHLLLLPASFTTALARPNLLYNGANYQIQRLTLHLAASVQLHVSPAHLSRRVSALALSIASRVPSCCIAVVTHFDEHTGWLTTPFLGGYPPP